MVYLVTGDNGVIVEWSYEKAFRCRNYFRRNKIKKYPTFAMAEQAAREHLRAILPSHVPVPDRIEMNDMLTVKKLDLEFKNKEGHYKEDKHESQSL